MKSEGTSNSNIKYFEIRLLFVACSRLLQYVRNREIYASLSQLFSGIKMVKPLRIVVQTFRPLHIQSIYHSICFIYLNHYLFYYARDYYNLVGVFTDEKRTIKSITRGIKYMHI